MLSDVHFEQDSWSLLWLLLQAARKETTILCFSAIVTGAFQGGSLEQPANHYMYATLLAPSDAGIDQVLCVARIGATLSAALQMADHL